MVSRLGIVSPLHIQRRKLGVHEYANKIEFVELGALMSSPFGNIYGHRMRLGGRPKGMAVTG